MHDFVGIGGGGGGGEKEEGRRQTHKIGSISLIPVARSHDARVYARSISLPSIDIQPADRLAGADVNVLVFKVDWDALLSIDDIAADELARNIVRPICDLWRQDARDILITSEQACCVGRGGKAGTGEIMIIGLESFQSC